MTRFKKLSTILLLFAILISVAGCKSNDGESSDDQVSVSLVGTWVLTKITIKSGTSSIVMTPAQAQTESTIIAKADGTYSATVIQSGVSTTETGTYYTTGGNKITFRRVDGSVTTTDYTLTGNKLVVVQTIMTPLGVSAPADLEFTKQ